MTKTAIKVRELDEAERHNKEMEKTGRISAILSGISGIAGTVIRPFKLGGALLNSAKSILSEAELDKFSKLHAIKNQGGKIESSSDFRWYKDILTKLMKGGK